MRSRSPQSRRSRLRPVFVAVAGLAAFVGLSSWCQAQAQTTLRKIEIVGLQRLSPDQVIQTSGLRVGQTVNADMLEVASDNLMKSGLFRTVSYRVRTADRDSTVIFEVTENAPRAPVAGEVLGQVNWSGNQVLSSPELSAAFGLRSGDAADRARIDKGLEAVRRAYGRKGYVAAQISEFKTADALNRRTNYQFTVREGAQYRMGALTITGLGPADTQQLRAKWTLAPGAVFNDSYLDEFKQNAVRPFVAAMTERTRIRSKFDFETKPDVRKLTADVVINFR